MLDFVKYFDIVEVNGFNNHLIHLLQKIFYKKQSYI